jgi:septal ring factor EnvC (AmiA/AmiB activator)
MSPLAEKLTAILEDRDKLAAALAECRNDCAVKEETITQLQQQSAKQSSDLSILKKQLASLQNQVATALLLATDPEDAKLKSRIEALYTALSPKSAATPSNGAPSRSGSTASPSEVAAALNSVSRSSDGAAAPVRIGPSSRNGGSTPARPATPPVPAGQALSAQEVAYRFVD